MRNRLKLFLALFFCSIVFSFLNLIYYSHCNSLPLRFDSFVLAAFTNFAYTFALVAIYGWQPAQQCTLNPLSNLLCGGDDTKRFLFVLLGLMALFYPYDLWFPAPLTPVTAKYLGLLLAYKCIFGLCYIVFTFSAFWHSYRLCSLFMIFPLILAACIHG